MMDAIAENRLLSRWATLLPRSAHSIGTVHESDCELVDIGGGRLLALTIDTVDEEVRLGLYRNARTVGRIAIVATLSDLAAVGADPLGLLLSVSLDDEQTQREVAAGVGEACALAGTFVLGGDTSESPDLMVSCVGAGTVPNDQVLRRIGMRPRDLLFASGPLGAGAAFAAARWLGDPIDFPESDFHPNPRLVHGRALRGVASACMDTSDGLVATLDQLARLNRLAVRIEAPLDALLDPRAVRVAKSSAIGALPLLAAHHGEFELVFSVPEEGVPTLRTRARELGWSPMWIGHVEAGEGLWMNDKPIDGAAMRNLRHSVDGDMNRYVRELLALTSC
jgi:thiamine-monophosphate kinase